MLKIVTHILYRSLPDDAEKRFRARILLAILTLLIVANFIVLAFFLFLAPLQMDAAAVQLAVISTAIAGGINVVALAMVLRGRLLIPALMVVGTETAAMWTVIWFTNGVYSPALPLLLAPVVFGFCLVGPRLGIGVAVASVLFLLAQGYGATYLGWVQPALQSRRNPAFDSMVIAAINAFIVIAVLLVYEVITARLRARLAEQASQDELTGVANRREFLARLAQGCARCNRSGHQLAVFYIDLNGFKLINDRLGHQVGDQVLMAVAARLRDSLRLEDVVARLGGDEFAVITEPRPDENYLESMREKLRASIGEPIVADGQQLAVGASIGVALYPQHGTQPEDLLRHADTVMYREKQHRAVGLPAP